MTVAKLKDGVSDKSDRATPEQSLQAVSAVKGGIANAKSAHARLADARMQLHEGGLKKTGSAPNRRGGYFELADFIVPAQKVLRDNGLIGVVSYANEMATLEIVNLDDPADKIVIASPLGSARLPNCHEVQNIGAVQTYQRRYLWMTAMEIVEHDALEGSTVDDRSEAPAPASNEWGVRPKDDGPTKTHLDAILKQTVREIEGCGDEDELTTYLQTDEYKTAKAALEEYRPSALYGPAPSNMPEFVPLKELVSRKVKMFRLAAQAGEPAPNNLQAG